MIECRRAEFETIDGCYYNEGRNDTINHVIKKIYTTLEIS